MKPDIPTLHKPDILICSDTPTKSLDNQPTHQYHLPRMNIMLYIVRLDWRGARRKLRLLEWRFVFRLCVLRTTPTWLNLPIGFHI